MQSPPYNAVRNSGSTSGESRRITDAKDGVSRYALSYDGQWLAYTAGKEDDRSVWAIRLTEIDDPEPIHLIDHHAPVVWWEFAPDSQSVYFIAPDSVDNDNRRRMRENFDVMIRNEDRALEHLWSFDMDTREKEHLTDTNDYAVSGVTISRDSKWIAYQGTPNDRYMRTVTERGIHGDNYLLEVETGEIERLTENDEIRESTVQFSSDSSMLAFSASNDFTYNRDQKIRVRPVSDRGGEFRMLGGEFDGRVPGSFWSKDGATIYSNAGLGATRGLLAVDVESGAVTRVVDEPVSASVSYDWVSDTVTIPTRSRPPVSTPCPPSIRLAIARIGNA